MKKYGLIIILFIIAIILVVVFINDGNYIKSGNLYISEIMASNSYTFKDSDGEYTDYIEIYNGNDYDINLLNYRLSDSIYEASKWRFPDITISSHEYLVIFASGKNKCLKKDMCHTNFKLGSAGEVVSLIDNTGNIISQISYENLKNDEALSYVNKKYLVTIPTPGKANSDEKIKSIDIDNIKIVINEYLTHNKGSNYNSSGEYSDWVELYNMGDDISLKGLSLSDEEKNLNKFMMPSQIIKKNEYLVVYLNGGRKIENGIAANFKLSDNDKKIILSANGEVIDEVSIVKLERNMSYGKDGDKWLYYYTPTPGKANTTHGIERIKEDGDT